VIQWGFAVWLFAAPHAFAQDVPLQVLVNGRAYLVNGAAISGQNGNGPIDELTVRKVNFTARVLDEQILHSEFNKQLFNATNRAIVFREQVSGRLLEPWRRSLLEGSSVAGAGNDAALSAAKEKFKEWATKLANDRRELALAIVRKDYRDGIAAYRENVAIYRKVIERNQTLTYDDALRLMRNEWLTMRLALARAVEERLRSNDALAPSNVGGWDQADANRLRPRLEIEVINRIDSDVKTADDLEASDKKLREIAKIDASTLPDKVLGDYVKAITELTIQIELWAAAYTLR
jgi:hypothetical protein